jgi:DNA-binding winged helix-turn-helix (wHTH) protein
MAPTMAFKEKSPLLGSAVAKLQPEVFSHPVWIRFGKAEIVQSKAIEALIAEAEELKQGRRSEACQILLICAVLQHYDGQSNNALKTIQKVQDLAQTAGFERETLWALWGTCAIYVQQRRFEQAAKHMTTLKYLLTDQNDWILADFIDVVRQAMLQRVINDKSDQENIHEIHPLRGVLDHTFRWLDHWGFSAEASQWDSNEKEDNGYLPSGRKSLFPPGTWQGLRLLFKGEVKVNWQKTSHRCGKRRSSFLSFVLSLFHINITSEDVQPETPKGEARILDNTETSLTEEQAPAITLEPKCEPDVSILVYMLGSFSMTVQERTLNLTCSRSLSLLKYLMLNHKQSVPREMLMDVFWPDPSPEKARNSLNVAMNRIRRALRTITDNPIIIYKDSTYRMASGLKLWTDVEDFERLVSSGKRSDAQNKLSAAISDYEAAISLYRGDFLEENQYEGWTVLPRERLRLD